MWTLSNSMNPTKKRVRRRLLRPRESVYERAPEPRLEGPLVIQIHHGECSR
jgi:hypothetical protein